MAYHSFFILHMQTQIQLQRTKRVRASRICRIFITHLHGDHVFGLPGLLCSISLQTYGVNIKEKSASSKMTASRPVLHLYGPQGLRRLLRTALCMSQSRLGYQFCIHELHHVPGEVWPHFNFTADQPVHPDEIYGDDIVPQV